MSGIGNVRYRKLRSDETSFGSQRDGIFREYIYNPELSGVFGIPKNLLPKSSGSRRVSMGVDGTTSGLKIFGPASYRSISSGFGRELTGILWDLVPPVLSIPGSHVKIPK